MWRCRYLCRRTKVQVFRSLVLPFLLYGCETWTLTKDLRRRLNSFGTKSLRRILGYRWSDFVSNERLLRETRMRFVTCIVREHQLRLYGHVARFPDADLAHQILSVSEPCGWNWPMGHPCDPRRKLEAPRRIERPPQGLAMEQNEIQSAHWSHFQVISFTICI